MMISVKLIANCQCLIEQQCVEDNLSVVDEDKTFPKNAVGELPKADSVPISANTK